MALNKTITCNSGVELTYHKIVGINLYHEDDSYVMKVILHSYTTKERREKDINNNVYVDVLAFVLTEEDMSDNIFKKAYELVRNTSKFANAEYI